MARPLCRYCAKPSRKRTAYVFFGAAAREFERQVDRCFEARPANKAEAQRYVNGVITSVRYSTRARINAPGDTGSRTIDVPRYVDKVTVWDGETYEDNFFCTGEHARLFGYAAAKSGMAMPAYNRAIEARGPK